MTFYVYIYIYTCSIYNAEVKTNLTFDKTKTFQNVRGIIQIALAKSLSLRWASHQVAFMSSCLTISHTFYLPIYLVHKESWCSMVSYDLVNSGSVGVFFTHGMVSGLWGELVLF